MTSALAQEAPLTNGTALDVEAGDAQHQVSRELSRMGTSVRMAGGSLAECHDAHQRAARSKRYWITWSARCSSDGGIVRPSALAVLRLITNSTLVGCSTGKSAGLAPLRILST